MRFVDGIVLRNREVAVEMPPDARAHASNALIDTLADIHEVDVDRKVLADLAVTDPAAFAALVRVAGEARTQGEQAS